MGNKDLHYGETILKQTYLHFSRRAIDSTLAVLNPDVDWPNGKEGGIEHGPEAVRNCWTRQWKLLDPHVESIQFDEEAEGRIKVTVHQVVLGIDGKLLIDQIINHVYTFEDGLVRSMEIRDSD